MVVGRGCTVGDEDEGDRQDDAQVRQVRDALGHHAPRRHGERDGLHLAVLPERLAPDRSMYGRTNSPRRKGMSRMAAKPIHETMTSRERGT